MGKIKTLQQLSELRSSIDARRPSGRTLVTICGGTGCSAWGSAGVLDALKEEIVKEGLEKAIDIKKTGCHGFCERGPMMVIYPQGILYQQIRREDVPEIVNRTLVRKDVVSRLLYSHPLTGRRYLSEKDIPFYKGQSRIVFGLNGLIDPTDIHDYILNDGYTATARALTSLGHEEIIEEVIRSGLRGRGGAGFPTGLKWRFCRQAPGPHKYIVCNADEGDPGAFMDRSVLEGNPHSVLEGMIIAAYAIGATQGYIYVRAEYPIAVRNAKIAVEQAEELGLLGEDIFGSGFDFGITVKEGAGAFVCGEETALIASIEGKRGMPRVRPPFPAQSGVWKAPTNINNVETFANIPHIINRGSSWFASIGTDKSKGTKILSLTGRINNTGLVEVPMGTTLRTIIDEIGGGVPRGRRFKAAQMGGPSGGCIPARYLDMPIDYESLASVGSMMGSGGLIVMDENNCMVDIARFFLSFTKDESCGKCAPCRLGTKQMLEILNRITSGGGTERDLELLESLARSVKASSLCGLGKTCANPVLSTLRYFRDEYLAHVKEKRCPAATCDAMVISACQHSCPAGIDVPNYVAYIAEGRYLDAVELIRERNPFPAICGRVCNHPCQFKCRRGELDGPVNIRSLKRFAADWYFNSFKEPIEPFPITKDQKVAIVGAGPAGLTCAYFLRKMGYPVTVFEALPRGGGMMGVAIPDFRLPRRIIQAEIAYIEARGVEIRYNTPINVDYSLYQLKRQGYSAIFIAAGAQSVQKIGIAGETEGLEGLYYGLEFLMKTKMGERPRVGPRVAVIGGGNTAIDSARTCLRLGARKVELFYRRTREEMRITDVEYNEGIEEGVEVHFLVSPIRILSVANRIKALEMIRNRLSSPDESGRRRPIPIEGTEFQVEVDTLIMAVGQAPDLSFISADWALERNRWGMLDVNPITLSTNIPGVFAGGDFITGPTFVINAIASGRRAALAIEKYLRQDPTPLLIKDEKIDVEHSVQLADAEEEIKERPPIKMAVLSPEERLRGFQEIEMGYTEEEAQQEARRCLRCDLEHERG